MSLPHSTKFHSITLLNITFHSALNTTTPPLYTTLRLSTLLYYSHFTLLFFPLLSSSVDESSCMRMVHEYYSSSDGRFDFLVSYLNENPSRGNLISDIYHHPAMAVLELLRGKYGSTCYILITIYRYSNII